MDSGTKRVKSLPLIARDEDSIITRRVAKGGKYAHTSYRMIAVLWQYSSRSIFDCTRDEPTRFEFISPILVSLCWAMTSMVVV